MSGKIEIEIKINHEGEVNRLVSTTIGAVYVHLFPPFAQSN